MDVKQREEARDKLIGELSKCRRCRFCLDACPVYQVADRVETMSAYGRLQTLRLLFNGVLEMDDSTTYPIFTCLQCGSCNVICQGKGQNLEVSKLIRAGKTLLNEDLIKGGQK
jgi:glycolate oxidase iron-sulfur subunit